jgi:hypothetical protein
MTKTEQNRVLAWRLKVCDQALCTIPYVLKI